MSSRRRFGYFFVNLVAPHLNRKSIRFKIYRFYGIKTETEEIGNGCKFVDGWKDITIGKHVRINNGVLFNGYGSIVIEDEVSIGCEVALITVTHEQGQPPQRRAGEPIAGNIRIGRGSWIGARAIILPNVTIGESCIVAAGAVVTKDCEPNGMYAGVPAKRIKDL